MLTLTTIVHSGRQNPDGTTEPISTHCFIAVVAMARAPREISSEHQRRGERDGLHQGNRTGDHQNYDYE